MHTTMVIIAVFFTFKIIQIDQCATIKAAQTLSLFTQKSTVGETSTVCPEAFP